MIMTKNLSITLTVVAILLVVAVVGIVVFRMQSGYIAPSTDSPVSTPPPGETPADSTSEINKTIDEVDLGNLEVEFQAVDSDLNSL